MDVCLGIEHRACHFFFSYCKRIVFGFYISTELIYSFKWVIYLFGSTTKLAKWEMGNDQCLLRSLVNCCLELLRSKKKINKFFNSEPGKTDTDNNRQFPLVCSFTPKQKKIPKLKLCCQWSFGAIVCVPRTSSGALTIKIW